MNDFQGNVDALMNSLINALGDAHRIGLSRVAQDIGAAMRTLVKDLAGMVPRDE